MYLIRYVNGTRRASSPEPVSLGKRWRYGTVRERGEGDVTVCLVLFPPWRMFGRYGWTGFNPGWVDFVSTHPLPLYPAIVAPSGLV